MKGLLRFAMAGVAVLAAPSPARAQVAADEAPPAWIAYAKTAVETIQGWMESQDPAAVRFKAFLGAAWDDPAKPAPVLALRLWIDRKGTITRVDFPPFANEEANADLTGLLVGHALGVPPRGMLQPVRLSISLAAAQTAGGTAVPVPD